jgi:hypothetical protein
MIANIRAFHCYALLNKTPRIPLLASGVVIRGIPSPAIQCSPRLTDVRILFSITLERAEECKDSPEVDDRHSRPVIHNQLTIIAQAAVGGYFLERHAAHRDVMIVPEPQLKQALIY